jgi:hypothetical protein
VRLARTAVLTAAVAAAALAGVAAASSLTDPSASVADPQDIIPAVIDGSESIDATAADPEGGPSWAVARFVNSAGRQCAVVGRSVDGRFGRVDGDGRYVPTPIGPGGVCGDHPSAELVHAVARHPAVRSQDARTIFFGMSSRVEQETVLAPDGSRHHLAPGARGAFLLVARGQHSLADWTLSSGAAP